MKKIKTITGYDDLAEMEAEAVNMLFKKSKTIALAYLNDAIKSFIELLESKEGKIVPSMDLDYRSFILKLLGSIEKEYHEEVVKEVLIPKYNIPMDEILDALKEQDNG